MMFYGEMQDVAREVLTEFAQGVVNYVKITKGNGPVDNPGPPTKTPYPIKGTASGVWKKYVDKGQAVASDMQIIAPVDSQYEPDMSGSIEADGETYKIVAIDRKPPLGTAVVFIIIFRKGG